MRFLWVTVLAAAIGCATVSVGEKSPSLRPTVEVLANGLTLIVQEHRASDIVAVYLWVATGVRYESAATLGHAHFQEHMLFKGTEKFGPGYIDRAVEGTGGRSNAFTTTRPSRFKCRRRRSARRSTSSTTWRFARSSIPGRSPPSAR